ncbi:MAG: DUF3307 domain-containing protein [Candidatus Promineifilaceae bacterium]
MNLDISSMLPVNSSVFIWAVTIHMVVDWMLQTDWMARNKTNLRHPAAYVHSGLHALGLMLVFPWFLALGVGVTHLLIDTRKPVTWWIETIKQMPRTTPLFTTVEIWLDQIFHVLVLLLAVIILPNIRR